MTFLADAEADRRELYTEDLLIKR